MAKPSQLQQPGVERATRDTPGKEKQKSDPGGIAALPLQRRCLVWASRCCDPSGIVYRVRETGGVAHGALTRIFHGLDKKHRRLVL